MRALKKHCENSMDSSLCRTLVKSTYAKCRWSSFRKESRHTARWSYQSSIANLFMHYAFDMWITKNLASVRFCRYADDGVIHCRSYPQAKLVLQRLCTIS
ncbi:hypothetical protein [Acinetobacter lwoffii]|uniref:hypothetical protein n=1 Tax=Acinetobacter lwoffii TaxID=28090 RepID=UPI00226B015D|nr:hypothetical protein [Acinetobacter lwoffii]